MYVKVRVSAGGKKQRVTNTGEHSYEIVVKEPAAQNAANQKVRALIAHEYGVTAKDVKIITGHRSPNKLLELSP